MLVSRSRRTVTKRLMGLNERNSKLYSDYVEYLQKSGKGKTTITNYSNKVLNFLETLREDQKIEDTPFVIMEDFISAAQAESSFNNRVYALKNFWRYLSEEKGLSLLISSDKLGSIVFSPGDVRQSIQRGAVPLTIEQVVLIRDTYKRDNENKRLFTFEMIYRHEVKWNDLAKCHRKNYSPENREFKITKNKSINIDDYIADLIERDDAILDRVSMSGHQYRLVDMSELLGRDVRWIDIEKTHDKNFVACPRCQKENEMQADNWVLVSVNENHTKWLVCKSCVEQGESND
ncbi:hypothetical protein N780_15310 [Pontibacillus chungwhensis BH030062]|uniref:Core-binding (CB) domain-containing protein n=1 Tax=Pontibacillus chungwhensis BH030062 TaxID=1385513 RepID=A0A0A2UVM9_9BACI|nr:hypothetical protein [Pontibacillus chungwhensis]KGP91979.1 hypothetical protein N780_15310 [Pontibacillus chungwhensis BH030062]